MEKQNPKTGAVLLVDDNKAEQTLISEAFKTLGIANEIIIADNGVEALKYLESDEIQPMLILCDINMPEMDGLRLREEIYNDKKLRFKCIPFIFISNNGFEDDINRAYEYAVQSYFEKAKNFDETVEMLTLIINYWKLCKHPNSKHYLLKEGMKK